VEGGSVLHISRWGQQAGQIGCKRAVQWVDELVLKEEEKARLLEDITKQ
jgi:hypothetical protein